MFTSVKSFVVAGAMAAAVLSGFGGASALADGHTSWGVGITVGGGGYHPSYVPPAVYQPAYGAAAAPYYAAPQYAYHPYAYTPGYYAAPGYAPPVVYSAPPVVYAQPAYA